MLADIIRSPFVRSFRTRLRAFAGEHFLLLLLAGAAGLSFLLYWLAFVRPYGLIQWQHYNQMDLQRISRTNPNARWYQLAAFAELTVVYALGWRAARELKGRAAWAVVVGGALAMGLVLLFLFPFGADDIFDNIMHGRILGVYGANPFVQVIAQYGGDAIRPYVGWPTTPSAYGPLWEMLAGATAFVINRLAGDTLVGNVLAFKVVGGLFLAGSVALTAAILRRVNPARTLTGVLLLAWNPVVLFETMGNGHNDIVMVFFMLAAAWLMLRRRYTLAVGALVAGGLVKFIPVLLLPAAGLIALRDLHGLRPRLRFVATAGLLGLALAVLAYAPFWQGADILGITRRQHLYTTSLPAVAYAYLQHFLKWGPDHAAAVVSRVAFLWTGLFALGMGFRALWDRSWDSFIRSGFYCLMFYLLVTVPWFQNWYALWPLALAILLPPGNAARLGQVFTFATLSKPLIFAPMLLWVTPFPPEWWRELRLGPAVMAVPWLYVLYMGGHALWKSTRAPGARAEAPAGARPQGG